jgi:hypothetical protein
MVLKLRRMRAMDPLQVAMTGVRMGERYLQIFCGDSTLTRGLALKTGLSGVAALATPDESQGERARSEAAKAGVLIDVHVTPITTLDWSDASFDMVVIDNTNGDFATLADETRTTLLREVTRLLRAGGRVELIESVRGGFLRSAPTLPASYIQSGGGENALRMANFKPVRTLAEKDGYRFIEGLKGA